MRNWRDTIMDGTQAHRLPNDRRQRLLHYAVKGALGETQLRPRTLPDANEALNRTGRSNR